MLTVREAIREREALLYGSCSQQGREHSLCVTGLMLVVYTTGLVIKSPGYGLCYILCLGNQPLGNCFSGFTLKNLSVQFQVLL